MSKKLVVLLSRQRSGTNALRSVLESHSKIHCFGEVLSCSENDLKQPYSYLSYAKQNFSPEELEPENHLYVFEKFTEYLHGLHEKEISLIDLKYSSCHHISKAWKNLSEVAIFNWILDNEVPVIRLRRDNYLRVSLSEARAQSRQKWHDFKGGEPPSSEIVLPDPSGDMNALLRQLKAWDLDDQIVSNVFEDYPNLLELHYTDMFPELNCPMSDETQEQVSKFLNVQNNFKTEIFYVKTEQRPFWESVSNWRDVRETLKDSKFQNCLIDEPMYRTDVEPVLDSNIQTKTATELLRELRKQSA